MDNWNPSMYLHKVVAIVYLLLSKDSLFQRCCPEHFAKILQIPGQSPHANSIIHVIYKYTIKSIYCQAYILIYYERTNLRTMCPYGREGSNPSLTAIEIITIKKDCLWVVFFVDCQSVTTTMLH